jgi:UDP-N-acetylmuramoyl-tripeptide--D-alanyl-D-alanine ligase
MMAIADLHLLYLRSAGVTTDTRNIQPGAIFFALKGDKFNANLFAKEALERGAGYAVIDEVTSESDRENHRLILVDDVLTTLQQLSGYHRSLLKCPVLAITGSNGKTTTKELIAAVLSKKYKTVATKGNLNNHIGVPLTILSTPLDTEFLILEMGANHQQEIAGYCVYADPEYGMITNIGKAHLEGFGGEEGVIKGKTELYAHIGSKKGKLFVSSGSPLLTERALAFVKSDQVIFYGIRTGDFCSGTPSQAGEFLSVRTEGGSTIQTNLVGQYNFDNVMAAICIGKYFGVGIADIKKAIESFQPSNNRSQKVTIGTNTILLDAYNANPSSMIEALKNFEHLEAEKKITILGEMMELGEYSEIEHLKIIDMVEDMDLSQRVFVGDGFQMLKGKEGILYFETTELLKAWYQTQQFDHTTQLIKGSRKNGLEKIITL